VGEGEQFPRFPSLLGKWGKRSRSATPIVHISTGTAANKGFDIDEVKGRIAAPASAMTAIGADIETGGATP
jgi:hypothetical protein